MGNAVQNRDSKTVAGFGDEWTRFDQSGLSREEHADLFDMYFGIFPWDELPVGARGFDMGCGSGRWAELVAPRVGELHCVDPSAALDVAKRNLSSHNNCFFHCAGVGEWLAGESSMDFGYSLGVLHHVPDTEQGIKDCVALLKPGAPFLLYLYYAFDNRTLPYRMLWRFSDVVRKVVSACPFWLRYLLSQLLAVFVYIPFARLSWLLENLGVPRKFVEKVPLSFYRRLSFYTMRTDALDRFGTRLEKRFTRDEIEAMMRRAGLVGIRFSEKMPHWCAVGFRRR